MISKCTIKSLVIIHTSVTTGDDDMPLARCSTEPTVMTPAFTLQVPRISIERAIHQTCASSGIPQNQCSTLPWQLSQGMPAIPQAPSQNWGYTTKRWAIGCRLHRLPQSPSKFLGRKKAPETVEKAADAARLLSDDTTVEQHYTL